ncbi:MULTISPECIES: hypothetical protein [Bacteria]|uniref:hypothetical protein n=1 Tax=Bacteria TaxID=2 RepID=UPI002FC68772
MRDVTPQNVEENKKRDEQERLKERNAARRQQRIDKFNNKKSVKTLNSILESRWFFWLGILCLVHLIYKYVF